jgi:phosphatidylinositol-3-phosphatase
MSIVYRCAVLVSLFGLLCCGGGDSHINPGNPNIPQFSHAFVVVLENHSFEQTIGQSAMPYLNSLVSRYALATNYFANVHPSLPNYFILSTGQPITADDNFNGVVTVDTVVNALAAAGKSWKFYGESMPGPGYLGADTNVYVKRHNPFAYFSTVQNDPSQLKNLVPFSQLPTDLAANQLPNFGFIVPNLQNDAHDCPGGGQSCDQGAKLARADAWLSANIQPLINNPTFQQSGLLLITFDESTDGDNENGGGHVPLIVISSRSKAGFRSSTFYRHENTLRLMLDALRVPDLPGAANGATQMGEFFQ